ARGGGRARAGGAGARGGPGPDRGRLARPAMLAAVPARRRAGNCACWRRRNARRFPLCRNDRRQPADGCQFLGEIPEFNNKRKTVTDCTYILVARHCSAITGSGSVFIVVLMARGSRDGRRPLPKP